MFPYASSYFPDPCYEIFAKNRKNMEKMPVLQVVLARTLRRFPG